MSSGKWAPLLLILAVVSVPTSANAAANTPGGKCGKVGAVATISQAKYLCTKTGPKLIWVAAKKSQVVPGAGKQPQIITVPKITSADISQATFRAKFTASSNLPVELASTTPAICQVQGKSIALLQTGICEITTSQPGNGSYQAAKSTTFSLQVIPPRINSDNPGLEQVETYVRVPLGVNYVSETAEIALTGFITDVSAKVCTNDPTADGCILSAGVGAVDPNAKTKYVEFDFHVKNLDANPLPQVVYRLLSGGFLSDISAGVTLETLNGLTVGTDESTDGSLYGIVSKDQKFDNAYLMIDEGITDPSIRILLSLSK